MVQIDGHFLNFQIFPRENLEKQNIKNLFKMYVIIFHFTELKVGTLTISKPNSNIII